MVEHDWRGVGGYSHCLRCKLARTGNPSLKRETLFFHGYDVHVTLDMSCPEASRRRLEAGARDGLIQCEACMTIRCLHAGDTKCPFEPTSFTCLLCPSCFRPWRYNAEYRPDCACVQPPERFS